jgi:methionine salvage enolase-phosphatase E1
MGSNKFPKEEIPMAQAFEKSRGQPSINVSRFLQGINFPVQKKQLLQQAQQNQADKEVINMIQKLDEREYTNMSDVMKGLGTEQQYGQKDQGLQQGQGVQHGQGVQQGQDRVQSKQTIPQK